MATIRHILRAVLLSLVAASAFAQPKVDLPPPPPLAQPSRAPDVIYVPTPPEVVSAMLKAAGVTGRDVIYDLGCGDGRIVIEAARTYGARGVGIDIDPERLEEAQANARKAGVQKQVEFRLADLFETDLGGATVITLYLLPRLNLQLRPKLLKLKPGTRIVSHEFDMGDWKPERVITVDKRTVYLWRVP
ncbi:MAG: methyltransferase domain-containing protein [Betaproteobacteria bacterium]|nr:methyltransferase domain-containing protein [Betaproteobacteria bacterium]